MRDTITAKCCKIYKIYYIDNLTAGNWVNGGWTPKEYQSWVDSQIKTAIANSTNNTNSAIVRTCPVYKPYTSPGLTQCGQCPEQAQLFNIKTRLCEYCPAGRIYNYVRHTCDYNVACPDGSAFN